MSRLKITVLGAAAAATFLAGCAQTGAGPSPMVWEGLQVQTRDDARTDAAPVDESPETPTTDEREAPLVESVRRVPGARPSAAGRSPGPAVIDLPDTPINVTLPSQPLPSFVNTVLGDILEVPFALGPGVADRRDMVALRSVRDMAPDTFFALFETAISEYGLALIIDENLVQVVERDELRNLRPEIIRSRARQSVPAALRPVIQFVTLEAIDSAEMDAILQATISRDELSIQMRRDVNALTLTGLTDVVDLALDIIEEMDRPRFAGAEVVTLSPRNWLAPELATAISEILTLEGLQVSIGVGNPRPIALLPIEYTGQILVFADDASALNHVIDTARRLDAAARSTDEIRPHVYRVQNTNAETLAGIAQSVLGEARSAGQGGESGPDASPRIASRLAVDPSGNRLIFTGTDAEFSRLARLFEQLDTPVPEVLVEVTIAEVTLNESTRFGVEFLLNTFGGDLEMRTQGGLGLESGGLSAVLRSGDVDLTAAARETNSQINILSTPRIVARSGSEASVQVGTDVPIITSQRAANTQQTGSTDILQTIQYRSTGVLLTVAPTVYSNNRIDLTISQEVSSAVENPNQSIASPIISNRSLTSEITLQDGQTAVFGGLMERRLNRGVTGVPFLQDVPGLGTLFSTRSVSADQTVLLVLVTPYLLVDREDRQRAVEALGGEMQRAFVTPIRTGDMIDRQSREIQDRLSPGGRN